MVATGGGRWSATNASRNSAAGRHQPSILLPGCHVIQQERPSRFPGMPHTHTRVPAGRSGSLTGTVEAFRARAPS